MTGPFSRTALAVVIGIAALSLAVAVALTVFGDDLAPRASAGADAYSVSALGHRGLVAVLERLDVPVVVSRSDSASKAKHGLLVVAEPKVHTDAARERLRALVPSAPVTLLVLPKWNGVAKPGKAWIDSATEVPLSDVEAVLDAVGVSATVHRTPGSVVWQTVDGLPAPVLHDVQTVSGDLVPLVTAGNGVLVGGIQRGAAWIWIVSDPEVIDNAGLAHAENARLAVALVDRFRDGGAVVFDETIHGHQRTPSLARVLFQFPLVLATLQVLFCAVVAVWAAMVRFGPRRAAPPPIAPGKDYLIRNTAALLRYGGHHAHALRRYLAASVQTVRHALHAPEGLTREAATAWLERLRLVRGGRISLSDLERAIDTAPAQPQRLLELADQVYRWRLEMMYGAQHRS